MNTLHLTPAEQTLFRALPEALREGWNIEHEGIGYVDTPARMELRMALLRVHDLELVELQKKVRAAQNMDDIARLIAALDLTDVNDDDLASLFFALGPDYLSRLLKHLLETAQTDKDVENITALTVIRHSILQAFHTAAHRS